MELAQLFQDLEALVVQAEPAVTQIEQKGEEVTENVGKGNTELDGAIVKARAARRKKWYCLGLVGKAYLYTVLCQISNQGCSAHHYYHRCCRGRCGGSQQEQVSSAYSYTGIDVQTTHIVLNVGELLESLLRSPRSPPSLVPVSSVHCRPKFVFECPLFLQGVVLPRERNPGSRCLGRGGRGGREV
jgi:hypothetical protein